MVARGIRSTPPVSNRPVSQTAVHDSELVALPVTSSKAPPPRDEHQKLHEVPRVSQFTELGPYPRGSHLLGGHVRSEANVPLAAGFPAKQQERDRQLTNGHLLHATASGSSLHYRRLGKRA
jgi:hypothetical protein